MERKHELRLKRWTLWLSIVNLNITLFSYLLTKYRVRNAK
jgi:hypothetical protein